MDDNTLNDHHHPTAGENVQSQGGIGRKAASAAGDSVNPQAGSPRGAVDVPGPSLDEGGGQRPHDGRADHGLTGDDGQHSSTDSRGTPAARQPGDASDLGAQGDQRRHAIPGDPAERVTGADTPNDGGIAGSPGGPKNAPERVPGQNRDSDATTDGSQSGNDRQRDSQI
ncbi:hypothetical protein [Rhodanobacter ginsenosidimutans]|uniref:Uncharacterized protein n=1 Tax=Rhodanobacter ginsenosidimutans TaxID=490571 RepID=A0ABW0JX44_9GAMM